MLVKKIGGIAVAVVVGIVVLALKFGAGFGLGFLTAKADAPDVGDCVTVSGPTSNVEVDDADCGDDDVLYKVVGKDDCDELEDSVVTEVAGKDALTICLWPDVADGTCIRAEGTDLASITPCGAGGRDTVKIVRSLEGTKAKCPKRSAPVVNKTRDLTLCVSQG